MKKRLLFFLMICLFAFVNCYCDYWIGFDYEKLTDEQKEEHDARRAENVQKVKEFNKARGEKWKITWHADQKYLQRARFHLKEKLSTVNDSLSAVSFAEELLIDFLPFTGIQRDELVFDRIQIFPETEHSLISYKQSVNNVFFDSLNLGRIDIAYNHGTVRFVNVCLPNFSMDTTPTITKREVLKIIKKDKPDFEISEAATMTHRGITYTRIASGQWETGVTKEDLEDVWLDRGAKLFIYLPSETDEVTGKKTYGEWKLAYKVVADMYTYYIDAKTGEIIYSYYNVILDETYFDAIGK